MIVADTGALIALVDRDDKHHAEIAELFERDPTAWVIPWAVLAEVDHLIVKYLGDTVATAFMNDLAHGAFTVEWGEDHDLRRAAELRSQYAALELGLVDSVVAAIAERLRASAIATLDLRDFGALSLMGRPKLYPRDL